MTYVVIPGDDNTTTIQVNFIDEDVELTGKITVNGGEAEALMYLPVFEADLRLNFADKFPIPEIPTASEGGI